jgi:hypothetical protein
MMHVNIRTQTLVPASAVPRQSTSGLAQMYFRVGRPASFWVWPVCCDG